MRSREASILEHARVLGLGDGWMMVFFNGVERPGGAGYGKVIWSVWAGWPLRGLGTSHPGGDSQKAVGHMHRGKRDQG